MIKGIDISEHQKSIDFQRVKAAGIQFVIPREGLRKRIDNYFLEYVRKAKEVGIAILGVYHFIYTDGATPTEGAQSTIANLKKAGFDPADTWIFADIEEDTWEKNKQKCTIERCTAYVKEYLDTLKSAGCKKLGIYTNNDYYLNYLDWGVLAEYKSKVWLADYTGGPDRPCVLQQTSDKGYVDGINDTVDTDLLIDESIAEGIIDFKPAPAAEELTAGVTADDVLAVFHSWLGLKKSDLSHMVILKIYNDFIRSHPGTGRGYIVQPTDQYCDTGFSAAFILLNAVDLIGGVECGVEEHVKIFQRAGIWEEDGRKTPIPGWGIVYNWDDTTQPNDGYSDHIGIVYDVVDGMIYCYECNMSGGKVGIRRVPVGYGCIRGFVKPKYAQVASGSTPAPATPAKPVKQQDVTVTGPTATVSYGSTGAKVKTLQAALVALGHTVDIDGEFGRDTREKVRKLQAMNRLDVDGIVGPQTWGKIYSLLTEDVRRLSKTPMWTGEVTASELNVRSYASAHFYQVPGWPVLGHGNKIDVCATVIGPGGDSWLYVRIAGGVFGFVSAKYIKKA